jgi:hypothetical protein
MSSTATCPNCKRPLAPGAAACPHCGTVLSHQSKQNALSSERLTQALPDVVKQLDSTASTNMTIAGVLIGFYAGAIFAGKVVSSVVFNAFIYALPVCTLLTTIIFALRVFYPAGYLTDDYITLIKKKEDRLRWSALSLETSVGILIVAIIVYLLRPA